MGADGMFAAGAAEGPGGPRRITATMTKHVEEEWNRQTAAGRRWRNQAVITWEKKVSKKYKKQQRTEQPDGFLVAHFHHDSSDTNNRHNNVSYNWYISKVLFHFSLSKRTNKMYNEIK